MAAMPTFEPFAIGSHISRKVPLMIVDKSRLVYRLPCKGASHGLSPSPASPQEQHAGPRASKIQETGFLKIFHQIGRRSFVARCSEERN